MSANTHTPGPWEVLNGDRVSVTLPCADVEASGHVSVCIAITHSSEPGVDKVANAILIAESPELLKQLINCRDRFFPADQLERDRDEMWGAVNGVIAKATGGAA